jgi:hypothetical protein
VIRSVLSMAIQYALGIRKPDPVPVDPLGYPYYYPKSAFITAAQANDWD